MPAATLTHEPFGQTHDGTPVQIYTLRNAQGCEARITNYGGIIVSLKVPDRRGELADIVLGFDRLADYLSPDYLKACPFFGAMIGRYGNRIARGTFTLSGQDYHIPPNDGANALHGGAHGFDKQVWEPVPAAETTDGISLKLRYVSADGEEGFPGRLTATVTYTLLENNALRVEMEAVTDKETVVNLTQHTYFNLHGAGQGDILSHEVTLHAGRFVPIDAQSLPLGNLRPVAGTPFDFTRPTAIGARIDADDEQLKHGQGYDHTFVRDGDLSDTTEYLFARVSEPTTGRVLEVSSTQPGVQFYTGNLLDGTITGKGGRHYAKHNAFCLEPQHFPDSPNQPAFPSVTLKPGENYRHTITYRFSSLP